MRSLSSTSWVSRLVFSTICARESSVADIYDPTLTHFIRDVLAHYGVVAMPCRIQVPIARKVESGVGHAKKTPLKDCDFGSLEKRKRISIVGKTHWRIRASTAHETQVAACSPKKNRRDRHCRSNPSATTSMENASFISMLCGS